MNKLGPMKNERPNNMERNLFQFFPLEINIRAVFIHAAEHNGNAFNLQFFCVHFLLLSFNYNELSTWGKEKNKKNLNDIVAVVE